MATYEQFCYDWIQAIKPHLLPGAFILAFASSRGWHRLACAMEDAGLVMQPSVFVNGMERNVPLCMGWTNSQGFPKSTRIDTQIDRRAGKLDEREVVGQKWAGKCGPNSVGFHGGPGNYSQIGRGPEYEIKPATPLARAWQGHRYGGQILRNALEPVIVCQKPWTGKRLDCIVETGAGTINVDGGRLATNEDTGRVKGPDGTCYGHYEPITTESHPKGRWPQNLILVHTEFCRREGERKVKGSGRPSNNPGPGGYGVAFGGDRTSNKYADADGLETVATWRCLIACPECGHTWLAVDKEVCPECKTTGEWQCAVRRLGEQSGERPAGIAVRHKSGGNNPQFMSGDKPKPPMPDVTYGDRGTCARYFFQADWSHEIAERLAMVDPVHYCPKSSRRERDAGLDGFKLCDVDNADRYTMSGPMPHNYTAKDGVGRSQSRRNPHPTCKPISLNRYLATLLLPPPEYAPRRILIPFAGVLSEAIGALLANWEEIVAIEMNTDYCAIGEARMQYWASRPEQMKLF